MKRAVMQIALYQPDIPQNLGSILRLCACFGVTCNIIEPCGFILDDKRLRRVAMDYAKLVTWHRHISWERFHATAQAEKFRIVLLTTKASIPYYSFSFQSSDILLLGRESAGVPTGVALQADAQIVIPLAPAARSLNIALAAAVALGEGIRQTCI